MASNEFSDRIQRLKSEQSRAIEDTRQEQNQWMTFKTDYEALKTRLRTLPDQLTHDVRVPFGKMAFMPGQLVHTNEILVLLGDNWFVERSAKQASEIVDRRLKSVDEHLERLDKQMKLLQPRQEFTDELEKLSEGHGGVQEIREEYDEEREAAWRVEHKKHVRAHRKAMKEKEMQEQTKQSPDTKQMTDGELWARLDQLEEIESKRREVMKLGTSAEEKLNDFKFPAWKGSTKPSVGEHNKQTDSVTKHERESDRTKVSRVKNVHDSDDDSDDDDENGSDNDDDTEDSESVDYDGDDGSDDDDEEEDVVTGTGKVITFSHTKTTETSQVSETEYPNTPGEIYTKFYKPKSILKKTPNVVPKKKVKQKVRTPKVAFEGEARDSDEHPQVSREERQRLLQAAFSGTVHEKSTATPSLPQQPVQSSSKPVSKFSKDSISRNTVQNIAGTNSSEEQNSVKPVSKFRAQRLHKS